MLLEKLRSIKQTSFSRKMGFFLMDVEADLAYMRIPLSH